VHPKGKAAKAPFFDTLVFPLWLVNISIFDLPTTISSNSKLRESNVLARFIEPASFT
jgi:hypothetical protein